MKMPFMKFYPSDWTQDTRVLTTEERGAWIDILCTLWSSETRGESTFSLEKWSRILGITEPETLKIMNSLKDSKVANVTINDHHVTVLSRRIVKEENIRKNDTERQRRKRGVTHLSRPRHGEKLEARSQKLETIQENNIPPNPLSGGTGEASSPDAVKSDNGEPPYQVRKDPVSLIIYGYKDVLGFKMDDRGWDRRLWARSAKSAKLLLDACGSWEEAVTYMTGFVAEYQKKGLDFTIETMVSKVDEWRLKYGKAEV